MNLKKWILIFSLIVASFMSIVKAEVKCPASFTVDQNGNMDQMSDFDLIKESYYKLDALGKFFEDQDTICLLGPETGQLQFLINIGNNLNCPTYKFFKASMGAKFKNFKNKIVRAKKLKWYIDTVSKDSRGRLTCTYNMNTIAKYEMIWRSK